MGTPPPLLAVLAVGFTPTVAAQDPVFDLEKTKRILTEEIQRELELDDPVTFRHILSHPSGLTPGATSSPPSSCSR